MQPKAFDASLFSSAMAAVSTPWRLATGSFSLYDLREYGCVNPGEPFMYLVSVAGGDAKQGLRRRYSDFKVLRDSFGDLACDLPNMPPKSVFRQRLSPSFRKSRTESLGSLLAAALHVDPLAIRPGVRQFLGLGAPKDQAMMTAPMLCRALGLPPLVLLDSIAEPDSYGQDDEDFAEAHDDFFCIEEENASHKGVFHEINKASFGSVGEKNY